MADDDNKPKPDAGPSDKPKAEDAGTPADAGPADKPHGPPPEAGPADKPKTDGASTPADAGPGDKPPANVAVAPINVEIDVEIWLIPLGGIAPPGADVSGEVRARAEGIRNRWFTP